MSVPTRDKELWALSLAIERDHGPAGPEFIAAKIGAFALAGEPDAVAFWRAIARRYQDLLNTPRTLDG